ncbi:MAG: tetratricopeptide repeat protein [Nitrospirae bacterium]|nr:tetratricopeptide repeat protein [Nitrospirota bacterium]NTW65179.1 tetratricopeptide repeat protein [Nitrospirota bacterium]
MDKILKYKLFIACSVAVVTFIVFLPALQNGFITNWDDDAYVYENSFIRSPDMRLLKSAFCGFHAANWHPLTWLSHALDYALSGLNPRGHHLTNNILHALNTAVVVYLVMTLMAVFKRNEENTWASPSFIPDRMIGITGAVTGLLFGLHPLHVESVAWIAERKDVLCAFFFLLALLMYVGYADAAIGRGRPFLNKRYLLSLGFFAPALMSKPMAVTLPFVLLIFDWYPFRRIRSLKTLRMASFEKLPFLVLSLITSILTIFAQKAGGAMKSIEAIPFASRLMVAAKSLIAYLVKMLVPANLVPYYPYPKDTSIFSFEYFVPMVLVVGITAACIVLKNRYGLLVSAWSYYMITLLPVLGIMQVGDQSMADRYTYLPSLGPFLVIGVIAGNFYEKGSISNRWGTLSKMAVLFVAMTTLVALSYVTRKQIGIWKNGIIFWNYVIEKEPERTSLARMNLGNAYSSNGQIDLAIEQYQIVLRLKPDDAKTHNNLGNAYSSKGFVDLAIGHYQTALRLKPDDAKIHNNLGNAYSSKGLLDMAIEQYRIALRLKPEYAEAYYHLGNAYLSKGLVDLAIEQYRMALRLQSDYAVAYNNLGAAYLSKGLGGLAIEQYEIALRLKPDDAVAHYNLGVAYAAKGQVDLAIRQYQNALQLKPDYAEAHFNLGFIYLNNGSPEKARTEFELGLKSKPDYSVARKILDSMNSK